MLPPPSMLFVSAMSVTAWTRKSAAWSRMPIRPRRKQPPKLRDWSGFDAALLREKRRLSKFENKSRKQRQRLSALENELEALEGLYPEFATE